MNEAILRAVPYGARLGRSLYKIDAQTGAVFVINSGVVKTVLTEAMAIVDQQAYIGRTYHLGKSAVSDAVAEQVKALACSHVAKDGVAIVGGAVRMNGAYKPRLKELRQIVPMESKQYEKYLSIYYRTVTEKGRELLEST